MYGRLFITGVHTGLGNALARAFLERGTSVYAVSRVRPEELDQFRNFHFLATDLSQHHTVQDSLTELIDGASKLDLVILNAGILGAVCELKAMPVLECKRVFDVNLWANKVIYDALEELNIAVEHYLVISSGSSRSVENSGGWGAYCASKAALNSLFQMYAHENPDSHITCLAPGLIDTPLFDEYREFEGYTKHSGVQRVRKAIAEGQMVSAEVAASRIIEHLPRMRNEASGSFLDIREMLAEQREG